MSQETDTQTQEVVTTSTPTPEKIVKTTTKISPPSIKTEHPQQVFEKKKVIFRTYQIIWYILAVIEVLLGFRMALKAIGANPLSGFTSFVYVLSDLFASPFNGIVRPTISGSSVIEWSNIIAALVYAILAYGAVYLMQLVKPLTPHEVEEKVDNT